MKTPSNPVELRKRSGFSLSLQVRFSDIDGYLHVNNGVYFNYFEHARAMFLHEVCNWDVLKFGAVVGRVEIDYLRPIHLEDQVEALVKCSRLGNSSFDLEQVLVGKDKEGREHIFAKCLSVLVAVDMKTMKPTAIPEEYRLKLAAG